MASTSGNLETRIIDLGMFRSMISSMDDTMDWLSSVDESSRIFSDMMTDGRVESLVENRQNRILRLDMSQMDSGNKAVDDACRKQLNYNKLQKLGRQLTNAIPEGIAISEIIWERPGNLYIPTDFIPVPRSMISFPGTGENWRTPYFSATYTPLNEPSKFLVHRRDRGKISPWGSPALRSVYWPWRFKKLGFKFWVMAAERIGVPSILALFEAKDEKTVKSRASVLADILSKIRSGSSAALGNVKDVKYLDASGAIKDFDVLVRTCNTEISYSLTGQSLTTNESDFGTKAQGVLHEDTFNATVAGDAQDLQTTMQFLYDWFVEANFPGQTAPRFEIDAGEHAPWEMITKAIELGIPVSKKAIYDGHKIPKPTDDTDAFVKPAGTQAPSEFSDSERFFFRTQR